MTPECDKLDALFKASMELSREARENPDDAEVKKRYEQAKEELRELLATHVPGCKRCKKEYQPGGITEFFSDVWDWITFHWKWVGGIVVVGAIIGAVFLFTSSKVDGSFESTGGETGTWTLEPSKCSSGERRGFFGVTLKRKGDDRHIVEVVKSASAGMMVSVSIPETCDEDGMCEAVTFTKSMCKVLDASVKRDRWRTQTNDIFHLEGHVKIDCETEGGRFTGEATFKDCH